MKISQTVDEFKLLVNKIKQDIKNYKDPIAFGICKTSKEKNSQPVFIVMSFYENLASAAIFIKALSEQGAEIDFNKSELVSFIDKAFIESSLNAFAPFVTEAKGNSHKNIQAIMAIDKQQKSDLCLEDAYKIIFIFNNGTPKKTEAIELLLLEKNKV